jgi:5-methylcytosine-specific restriction enzyme B
MWIVSIAMSDTEEHFELNGKDAHAAGVPIDNGFVVRAGSIARKQIVPSAADTLTPIQKRLASEGVLIEDGNGLRFAKDHRFDSPSGAAAVVLGRNANGWIEWKRPDGQTLSKVKRVSRESQEPILDDAKRKQIIERHQQLMNDGKLPSQQQLDKEYGLFRERFGPQVLAGLDGEPLLNLMHDHSNRDSLVYWLEFKNDVEFETSRFGSIAGGSALKFRIFRRKETGNWQAGGNKANHSQPKDITTEEAIEIARIHRDQLLKGVELLEALPKAASDEEYAQLQDQMDELSPDVSRLGWGHKYFSLLFPDKLDDYHSPEWQRYILLKMLQLPPEGDGRYICAGRLISASREVGIPFVNFDSVFTFIHGGRHCYWRVGTRSGDTQVSHWQMMQTRQCVAVGWPNLGDLSWVEKTKASREKLKALLKEKYPNHPSAVGNGIAQITQFVAGMSEGDVVMAADGATILGIGKVKGGYRHDPEFDFPHQRDVEWLELAEWKMPETEGLQSTVREIRKHSENILAVERRIQGSPSAAPQGVVVEPQSKHPLRLAGIPLRIQSVLERKGQVLLYGPPGTGKTFWSERAANDLAAISAFGKLFESLDDSERKTVVGDHATLGASQGLLFWW